MNDLDLTLVLQRVATAIARRLDAAAGHGLGATDLAVLTRLDAAPGHRMRRVDLANALAMSPSGVTRLLLPLEKIGLVRREVHPDDARVAFAAITDTGRAMLAEARPRAELVAEEALAGLEDHERIALRGLLDRLDQARRSSTMVNASPP